VPAAAAQRSQGKGSSRDGQCSGPHAAFPHKRSSGDAAGSAVLAGGQQWQQQCQAEAVTATSAGFG